MTLFVSYVIHGYRPRPEFHHGIATDLFDYGKWILGSGIVLFLINQGDDAFVGWYLGATALGFYQLAYRFSNAPATEVTHIISRVVFPTYSQIQTDKEKLRTGYFRTVQIVTVISFPMAVGIAVVAPTFVRAFLGEQWLPTILAMQILAFWGIIRSLGAAVGPLFNALGQPDVNTKLQTLKLVIIAIFIYPATAQ
jgi:PST family polysaccharide transporter/lipopolysaccharide exporter